MKFLKELYPAFAITIALTVITGIAYPFVVTGLAYVLFKDKAQGSLIVKDGKVVGSRLIGQQFQGSGYFRSRPSAAGNGYDAAASSGMNLGPTSKRLFDNVKSNTEALRADNPNTPIPIDLVTASASGLDPHITPAAAEFQVARVARERGIREEDVLQLVREHTEGRQLGVLGEPRINVLELNLTLDAAHPIGK